MDYLRFVEHHRASNADITIGCLPQDKERASDFGLMKIDGNGQITVRHPLDLFRVLTVRATSVESFVNNISFWPRWLTASRIWAQSRRSSDRVGRVE